MPVKIEFASSTPERVRADLLAVPVFTGTAARPTARTTARSKTAKPTSEIRLGPGADPVDKALGGTLLAFIAEAGFEAKRGEVLAVPTAGRLGAKAAVLVGMGDPETLDADTIRRAGAALARRSAKVETVATTLLDAVPIPSTRPSRRRRSRKASRSGRTSSSRTSRMRSRRGSHACRCSGAPVRRSRTAWRAARASRKRSRGRVTW